MQLRDLLGELFDREDVGVDVDECVLERVERVWEQPRG